MKQEIKAISDAIDNRDMEFLGQYGGMGEAGESGTWRWNNFPKRISREGVSIDDYSTFRATRFSEPV